MTGVGSVVIPAHNEGAVIGRCLRSLFESSPRAWQMEVVVVCNGCTDDTARRARGCGFPVTVVEIVTASKAAALRAADATTSSFPRIYLDADIVLGAGALDAILDSLNLSQKLAVRPRVNYDVAASTMLVRRYYRARTRLPALQESLWGAGCFALGEQGRCRFSEFPDLVSDDLFVDQHFAAGEKQVVQSSTVTVTAPKGVKDLMLILRRQNRGNSENRQVTGRSESDRQRTRSVVREILHLAVRGRPCAPLDAATYMMMSVAARLLWRIQSTRGWERDESSRDVTLLVGS